MDLKPVNDIPITDPNVYFTPMGQRIPLLSDRGNGYGRILEKLFLLGENPIVQACKNVRDRDNPLTGSGGSGGSGGTTLPIVWIVVPFQSTGTDGREEQQEEFLRVMGQVREALSDEVDLRVRFTRQVFSSYIREFPHPFSEKPYFESTRLFTPKFNRGALLNAAIDTIENGRAIYTHDVDLVPSSEAFYKEYAREIPDTLISHLAGSWDRYAGDGKSGTYLGGIAGMTPEGWRSVNGYPNDYFGWGGEDDEFLRRVKQSDIEIDHYDKARFEVRDLEEIPDVETKRRIIGTREADNLVKNELKTLYTSGAKTGGLDDVHKHTIITHYTRENEWADTLDIVILPSAYTTLPPASYISINESDSRKDMYREALFRYKQIGGSSYNWNPPSIVLDTNEKAYIQMRLPIQGYGYRDRDTELIRIYRERFRGMNHYKHLIMDEVGSYSISYPETGEQMANIMKMILGENASVIDGTACLGGNTGFFAKEFTGTTIAIEINPFRADFLRQNLGNVYLANQGKDIKRLRSILEISLTGLKGDVFVIDGDSQEVLLPRVTESDLEKCSPIADALFVDPPWGGPGYGYTDKRIGLEMTTRRNGNVTGAEYLRPIIEEAIAQRKTYGERRGILSRMKYVFMKVPRNYDLPGLKETLEGIAHVYDPMILVPDRTKRDRVFLVIMRILHN
jgi:hypothetical protein